MMIPVCPCTLQALRLGIGILYEDVYEITNGCEHKCGQDFYCKLTIHVNLQRKSSRVGIFLNGNFTNQRTTFSSVY